MVKKSSSFTLTLFLLINTVFSTYPQESVQLMQIEYSQIERQKEKVIQELKRNAYLKIGLIATIGATMSYGCYKLFFAPTSLPTAATISDVSAAQQVKAGAEALLIDNPNDMNAEVLKKVNEEMGKYRELILAQKEICDFHGYYASPTKNWWPWLKSWGQYFGAQYVTIGIASIVTGTITPFTKYLKLIDKTVDSIIDNVFHNADLNWYLSSHTNLSDLYVQIEQDADLLINTANNNQDFTYYRAEIINCLNLYILQVESILGFMTYKSNILAKDSVINAQRGRNLVNRLMTHINEQVLPLQTIIHSSTISGEAGAQLKSKLASINTVMQESLHSFAAFEVLTMR